MNEAMLASRRTLGVHAALTLQTGVRYDLDGDAIVRFSVEEGSQSALLPGNALSARLTMELNNDDGRWRSVPLMGATAQIRVECEGCELPCGVFIIDSISAVEHGGVVKLCGSDSIASELALEFVDEMVYPATLEQVWLHWLSKTRYEGPGAIPNGGAVIPDAPDWGQITMRKAGGWIAQAAGCFLKVNRLGALELVSCGGEAHALGPDAYWDLDDGFDSWGPAKAVRVKRGEVDFTVGSPGETVLAEGNPLLQTEEIAQGMLSQLGDMRLEKCSFTWRGDPSVGVGDRIALTDTYGRRRICTVTRQTMQFDRGFSVQTVCAIPDQGDGGIIRAITPEGGVNAGALVGTVDGGLLAAGSVVAKSIAANSITAEKLAANTITSDKITAGAVTADKLDANTVSAQVAKFVAAQMDKLTAGEIAADELYAAFAHVLSLSADSIAAGRVEADVLASALARVVSLYAGTGEFDFAVVQNLVSSALSLQQGAMDEVYIKNLAVTSANLLSATLGKLVIKGDDGKYYRVFVGSDGKISTEEVEDVYDEVAGGMQIVETSMNVGSLNASDLQASGAVINSILTTALTAGKITAADAMMATATIPALYTTAIEAIENSLLLTAKGQAREAAIQLMQNEISMRVTSDVFTYVAEALNGKINGNTNDIGLLGTKVGEHTVLVENHSSQITQLSDAIRSKVESTTYQADIHSLNDRIDQQGESFVSFIYQYVDDIEELQSQIDGNITTWFEDGVPTVSNPPANQWTTTDAKNAHLGDLYYDRTTGYCYRWQLSGNVFSWMRISDTDVTKALSDAAAAQDTADSKRRVFVAQPVPPYDVGDLWVQGTGGDIMRCQIAKASGSYSANDWAKASKYTDDTKANENAAVIARHSSEITQLSDSITSKVSSTTFAAVTNALNANIDSKASSEALAAVSETLTGRIDQNGSDIGALAGLVVGQNTLIEQHTSQITQLSDSISSKVESTTFAAVTEIFGGRISENTSDIGQLGGVVGGQAALISQHTTEISQLSNEISSKVSSKQFNEKTDAMDEISSQLTQRADRFEAAIEKKVDGETLRGYIRYDGSVVEIGRSNSRYISQTSDEGFVVLQDGVEMTAMKKNTVSAPVIEAKRQFVIGDFVIREGADGGLLIL